MVVFRNKQFAKCEEFPDTDFTGNADWVLNDDDEKDAELEAKIIGLYPNFDFVFDDDGNISDVVETERVVTTEEIEAHKTKRIQESKILLAKWLNDNPILYTDGKYYSVTEEKQALLNGNLASYERATKAGIEYPLKWNSTGEECVEWSYDNLLTLSLSIAAYVASKVTKQQNIELVIKACETMDEINAVVIDYDRNGDESKK